MLPPKAVAVVFLSLVVASWGVQMPKYFTRCDINGPDVASCIGYSASKLLPRLVQGDAELGLPSMNWFKIPDVISPPGESFRFKLVNGIVGELRDVRYIGVTFNRKVIETNATAFFPELRVKGYYEIDGTIGGELPIQGRGLIEVVFADVSCDFFWNLRLLNKGGKDYINVIDLFIEYTIGGATYSLSGLYGGDEASGEVTRQYLNRNWKTLARIVAPTVIDTFREVSLFIGRKVDSQIPIRTLFKY